MDNISLDTNKVLGKAMVELEACYECEVWLVDRGEKNY